MNANEKNDKMRRIAADLLALACAARDEAADDGCESFDFRIQYDGDDAFDLHTGDASYDTDHRGFWGAGSIAASDDDATVAAALADAVNQAIDDCAVAAIDDNNDDWIAESEVERAFAKAVTPC